MAKLVKVVFAGDTKDLNKAFDDTEKRTQSFGESFKKAGLVAAAGVGLAGAAVFKFGKDSIQTFLEDEKVTAQFTNALENIAPALRPNVEELNKWNEKLSINLALDDEAILSAQTMAIRFGASKDALKDLTIAAADLATVQGVDLNTAMGTVLKAAEGSQKAFKELGIEGFKPTGDKAKDLQTVMDRLTPAVGGAAAAAADTASAAMDRLKNAMSNIQSSTGQQLLTAFIPGLIDGLTGKKNANISDASKTAAEKMQELADKIAASAQKFYDFGQKVGKVLLTVKDIFDALVDTVRTYIELLNKLPFVDIGGAEAAMDKVVKPGPNYPKGKRAVGGPVIAGQSYLVGENGPEMFRPGTSGSISPNGGGWGGSGTTVVVNIQGSVLSERDLADAIQRAVTRGGLRNVSFAGGLA